MNSALMVPDLFTELTGWRRFNTCSAGRVLVSANVSIPWLSADPGEAVCTVDTGDFWGGRHPDGDECPSLRCSCGYYAYKTSDDAIVHRQGHVLARVALWGRIAEHARGYRAARIRLAEIFIPPTLNNAADALRARYGVPVSPMEEAWISANRNASSSWSPLLSQSFTLRGMVYT